MTLRVMIIGCGAVAQRLYRKPLQWLEKRGILQVSILVDPVAENAEALNSYFPKAKVYHNLEDRLATSDSELALILSPANLHCSHAIHALRQHSHILCEKPMALSRNDCALINTAAVEAKRIVAIGMIRRFFPAYAQFKQIIQDGKLGSLVSFEYREGQKFEWDVTTPSAFKPRSHGGTGVLFDIGPHVVDYITWTLGDLKVLTHTDDALKGVEANLLMEVESINCPGSIHLSWDSPQANEFRVMGSKGEAVLRVDRFDQLAVRTSSGFEPQSIRVSFPADTLQSAQSHISPRTYAEAIYCQIIQVIRAIKWGERPAVDGDEGEHCITLLESSLLVARPLDMSWLGSLENEAFRQMHWTSNP